MASKILTVNNICSLFILIRVYYTFTVDHSDEARLSQSKPCEIAQSYYFNDTKHTIPVSSNTSIIYPLLSCGIPYKLISVFNDISPFPISESYNLIHILPKLYSFEVSLFIQHCFIRICHLLNIFDTNASKLLYHSSVVSLAINTHNLSAFPLQSNLLIVFVWFVLESRQYCKSNSALLILRNMVCGAFVSIGAWINVCFIVYAYPFVIFVFIDNAILWKTRSKANLQKNVVKTTLNLTLWSTFFALAIVIVSAVLFVTDMRYFEQARLIPLDQFEAYWNGHSDNDSNDPFYTHLLRNMPFLYSFLCFYLVYFVFEHGIKGLETALFYSKQIALLTNTNGFNQRL